MAKRLSKNACGEWELPDSCGGETIAWMDEQLRAVLKAGGRLTPEHHERMWGLKATIDAYFASQQPQRPDPTEAMTPAEYQAYLARDGHLEG